MHKYLRSIGLKSLDSKKKVREFLAQIIENPDSVRIVQDGAEGNFTVITKELNERAGIVLCGEYEEKDRFRMDSYFPYVTNEEPSVHMPCKVMQQAGSDSYCGMCEDFRLGVSLIFFLNNFMYMKDTKGEDHRILDISLSGLADEGKIIFAVQKSEGEIVKAKCESVKRGKMIEQARSGNAEAMESLTLEEMSLYQSVSRRIMQEDLYSIVDSYFMPTGMECDQYAVMGDITTVEEWENPVTKEEGYYLMIDCNDVPIQISIQKEDLLGEPMEGRRFKGTVWMQGTADFL